VLKARQIDPKRAETDGALRILSAAAAYTVRGNFDPEERWSLGLIRSRGRVNYGRRPQPVSAFDESQQALGGDELSIRRAIVAAGERPTVI